jgi:hypothetical protein
MRGGRAALMVGLAVILAAVGGAQSSPATPPKPPGPPEPPSTCDARTLTWLVGKPKSAIPVAADLSHRRVACTGCPMTDAPDPTRTDILFDAQTGTVKSLTCG